MIRLFSDPHDYGEHVKLGRFLIPAASLVVLLLVWVAPLTQARTWPGIAFVVAADRPITLVFAVVSVVAFATCILLRRFRRGAIILGIVCLVGTAMFGLRVIAQGAADGEASPANAEFYGMAWNARGEDVSDVANAVGPTFHGQDRAVVVLPETPWKLGEEVADILRADGHDVVAFAPDWTATSIIMTRALVDDGQYKVDERTPPWAGLALIPTTPSSQTPIIVGTHIQQPSPSATDTWQEHIDWVNEMCSRSPWVVVLGDMNSTLNNLGGDQLGDCSDVAAANNAGSSPTWPTTLPPFLGASIDRFLVGKGYTAAEATWKVDRSLQIRQTDHWPIKVSIPPIDRR